MSVLFSIRHLLYPRVAGWIAAMGRVIVFAMLCAVLYAMLCAPAAQAQQKRVEAVVRAADTHAPISPYVYGHFLEHAGHLVNDVLWAEMLDDRKFYHPVVEQEPVRSVPGRVTFAPFSVTLYRLETR